MLKNVSYVFGFREATGNALDSGILANCSVALWVDSCCVAYCRNWSVRKGENGPWPCPPQNPFKDREGKPHWAKLVSLWPKTDGGNNAEEYRHFNEEFRRAYSAWLEEQAQVQAPTQFSPLVVPSAVLPEGWRRVWSKEENMNYYVLPDGRSLWEDDDEVKGALGQEPPFPPPPPRRK